MFGISFSEILLIIVIALLIFGPEQLPIIATKIGRLVSTLRNLSSNLRQQFYEQSGLNQFESVRQEMQTALQQLKQQIQLPSTTPQNDDFLTENEFMVHEYQFFYQPELDFERQPELFDEISNNESKN